LVNQANGLDGSYFIQTKEGNIIMKKKVWTIVSLVGFLIGVYMILTANTGIFFSADVWSANIAGVVICAFFGANATLMMTRKDQ
jgi:hypothetical protein